MTRKRKRVTESACFRSTRLESDRLRRTNASRSDSSLDALF